MIETISDKFLQSINENIAELSSDLFDDSIEMLASENSPLSHIPIISFAISTYRIGRTVTELHYIRQLFHFINGINTETIKDKDKHDRLIEFYCKDNKARNKELEYIILIISKYISEDKPKNLAKLYIAYCEGKINWEMFVCCSEVLGRFLPGDLDALEKGNHNVDNREDISGSVLRLCGLGILVPASEKMDLPFSFSGNRIDNIYARDYQLSLFGIKMRECLGLSDDTYLDKVMNSF